MFDAMNIEFGNIESIVQLSVALNIAFFTFREFRGNSVKRYTNKIAILQSQLDKISIYIDQAVDEFGTDTRGGTVPMALEASTCRMHNGNLEMWRERLDKYVYAFDRNIEKASLFFAVLGFVVLLLIATIPDVMINSGILFLLSIFLYSSVIISVFFNRHVPGYLSLEGLDEFAESINEFDNQVVAEYKRLSDIKPFRIGSIHNTPQSS